MFFLSIILYNIKVTKGEKFDQVKSSDSQTKRMPYISHV